MAGKSVEARKRELFEDFRKILKNLHVDMVTQYRDICNEEIASRKAEVIIDG